jgi:formate dehydrogenase iron-sulfur subunit
MGGMTPFPVLSALQHYPQDFGLSAEDVQAAQAAVEGRAAA